MKKHRYILPLLAASFLLAGCPFTGGGGTKTPTPPSTTGNLNVSIGFGAVGPNAYNCQGSGTIEIVSASGEKQSKPYNFSGLSQLSPPACRTSVFFKDLKPGIWTVAGMCRKNVTAGQTTQASINNGACH